MDVPCTIAHESGIYQIKNLVNGKIYIGSTGRTFDRREYEHFYYLENNIHENEHLQNSYNYYGIDSSHISEVCNKRYRKGRDNKYYLIKSANGYGWRWK